MIEVNKVSKTYNKNTRKANTVLELASLQLPDKGFIFIIGKSGIGKSTILNAIGGLISYEGEILYDKQKVDIEQYRRRNIGYVFQDFLLFDDLSVRENIKVALNLAGVYDEEEISRRVNILLNAVGLNINSKRRAAALSLGQRQRVAIARALASNPHIILADEPTGNLDSKNSVIVMDILKNLSANHLVICVTHNISLVNIYADQAYAILNRGFTPVNPKDVALEDNSYLKRQVDVGGMTKEEYKNDNFLLKLYSASGEGEPSEIKIIRQDGKILVVGDNIQIASPSEVELAEKKIDQGEKAVPTPVEKPVDLNFEERKEKRKFSDSPLLIALKERLFSKREKKGRGRGFFRLIEVAMPIAIFALLCGMFISLSEIQKFGQTYDNTENAVGLVVQDQTTTESLTYDQAQTLLDDPESGIIDVPTGTHFVSKSSYGSSITNSNSLINTQVGNFDVIDKSVTPAAWTSYAINFGFADISKYGKIAPELTQYHLKTGETVIDASILSSGSTMSLSKIPMADGRTFEENLIGTNIWLDYHDLSQPNDLGHKPIKIVGVCDTGFGDIFLSSEDVSFCRKAMTANKGTLSNYAEGSKFPDLTDYLIVDYANVHLSGDYTFVKTDPSLNEESQYGTTYLGTPLAYVSAGLKKTFPFAGGFLKTDENYTVTYNKDPSKNVICFVNYDNGSTKTVFSHLLFNSMWAYSNFRYNSTNVIPDSLTITGSKPTAFNQALIPSWMLGPAKDISSFNPYLGHSYHTFFYTDSLALNVVGTYASTSYGDPIYTAPSAELFLWDVTRLSDSSQYTGSYHLIFSYDNKGVSPKYVMYNTDSLFVTADAEKTAKYFEAHPVYGVVSYTYAQSYKLNVTDSLMATVKALLIAIGVLMGIMVLIMVLDNVSRINKEKYRFGVLRCLGMGKTSLLLDDSANILVDWLSFCFVPTAIIAAVLGVFHLFYLGWWYLVFLLALLVICWLSSEIPLIITLHKKPVDIIRSLS